MGKPPAERTGRLLLTREEAAHPDRQLKAGAPASRKAGPGLATIGDYRMDKVCVVDGCGKAARRDRRMCSMHASRLLRHGSLELPPGPHYAPRRSSLPERIKVMSEPDENGCWIWRAARTTDGYGRIKVGEKMVGAHRASYEAFRGPIPAGLVIDHLCFTPACVNPDHLRVLTKAENDSNQRRTQSLVCARGHEYPPDRFGPKQQRRCRECRRVTEREGARRRYWLKKQEAAA